MYNLENTYLYYLLYVFQCQLIFQNQNKMIFIKIYLIKIEKVVRFENSEKFTQKVAIVFILSKQFKKSSLFFIENSLSNFSSNQSYQYSFV